MPRQGCVSVILLCLFTFQMICCVDFYDDVEAQRMLHDCKGERLTGMIMIALKGSQTIEGTRTLVFVMSLYHTGKQHTVFLHVLRS